MKFEEKVGISLGSGVKQLNQRDGTGPMLVQSPGAEPAWIRLNWTNPKIQKAADKIEAIGSEEVSQNSAGPLLPMACLASSVMSGSNFLNYSARFSSRQGRCHTHRSAKDSA